MINCNVTKLLNVILISKLKRNFFMAESDFGCVEFVCKKLKKIKRKSKK